MKKQRKNEGEKQIENKRKNWQSRTIKFKKHS